MPFAVVPSFARGEISPALHGRVDTALYHVGLATAENIYIHTGGGFSNRTGLKFVGPVKDHSAFTRLVRFKFKTTDTYCLEFGNLYMRPIRNDSHVLESSVAITGATQADPVVITAASHGYADGDHVYISGVVGMTELNGRYFEVANKTANTFELVDQLFGGNVDGTAYTAYSSGGTTSRLHTVTTPYTTADLATLKMVQSADVVTITHPSYDPRELTRTDHDAWTLSVINFAPDQVDPNNCQATQNGTTGSTTYRWRITAISEETLEESLPGLGGTTLTGCTATAADPVVVTKTSHGLSDGDEIECSGFTEMTEVNGRRFTVANKTANTFELENEDGSGYAAETTGGSVDTTFVRITNGNATLSATNNVSLTWDATAGAKRYAVYREDNGLFGLHGETETESYTDKGEDVDFDGSPPNPREPFLGADNKPAAVSFYEQRRVFGGTNNKPDTSFYTQTGRFANLSVSTPANPDDAITATLNSLEVNEIRHFVPLNDLVVLTSGEEWKVTAGEDTAFSADTIRQKPQSRWGAGHQPPVTIGNTVLFVCEHNAGVRSLGYSLEVDGYRGGDVTVLATHLFRHARITDSGAAHAKGVDPRIYYVRDDGVVACLTFEEEQQVVGWTRWTTPGCSGRFESVAALRANIDEPDEEPYFVVKRVVAGPDGGAYTVRYIERCHDRRFKYIQDCFFVDSGVSVDSPVTITGVSLANPCVVTAASHGFSNGDEIDLSDITWVPEEDEYGNLTQPDQLNGYRYTVANKTANTFELQDDAGDPVDSSAFTRYVENGEARATFTEVAGLYHLEGQAVAVLADGCIVDGLTVSDGAITLPEAASRAHVGLSYHSDAQLLNLEPKSARDATLQGRFLRVARVIIRFERSCGMWIGPGNDKLTEMGQERESYDDPPQLLTGDREVILEPNWDSNGRVFIRQRDPLPLTVLMVVPKMEMEDD